MSSPERIAALDAAVIAGIAAGEVVERPASIVKELVENSLDAGARRVTVALDTDDDDAAHAHDHGAVGGTARDDVAALDDRERASGDRKARGERLAVTDDGGGIAADQLELAVARHATSKIRSLADLERVATFGFRGEALSSIAGVSRLELLSRVASEPAAARIVVEHGVLGESGPAASRPGTRITVSQLFANVPARRKFLKSASAEVAQAGDVLRRFALARPDVQFRFERNGRCAFEHAPVAGLAERLRQVYGADVGAAMVALDARYKGLAVHGAVSTAGTSWGSARRISCFVNGRFVQDRLVFRTVMEAYRTYLLKGRYPAAALFLEIDPTLLDVNVHPQKLEVRFREPAALTGFLIEAIREALRSAASPLGRWGTSPSSRRPHWTTTSPAPPTPPPAPSEASGESERESDNGIPGYVPVSASAASALAEAARAERVGEPLALFEPAPGSASDLEVVGQIFAGYVVCQSGDDMVLIDQHAAHERVLFERLMRGLRERTLETQGLLVPLSARVGGDGVEAVARFADRLRELGWDLEPFGDEDVVVRAVPAVAANAEPSALVEGLVAELARTGPDVATSRLAERVMATVACHAAVRVGKRLDARGTRALLDEIGSVDFAACCPHGRPVARVLDRGRIERMFGR